MKDHEIGEWLIIAIETDVSLKNKYSESLKT